jgi:hypothetical protein
MDVEELPANMQITAVRVPGVSLYRTYEKHAFMPVAKIP